MHNKEGIEFVKWFSELSNKDISIAGGKGASLAEMANNKFPIPPGFIITAQAYKYFIEQSNLDEKIKEILNELDIEDTERLQEASKKIRKIMENADMPDDLSKYILEAYEILDADKQKIDDLKGDALGILKKGHEPPFVAVRSSATTEDLADASFAGQQESFLNVKGNRELVHKVKECFSSLFTARAIYYRQKKGFSHDNAYLAVVVQKMVDSEKSGVIFSENPLKKNGGIVIEAVWGLGEGIVSGKIKPDHYIVDSNLDDLKILEIKIADKKIALTRDSSGKNTSVKLVEQRSKQQVLSNYEIKRLAQYSKQLERHYEKPQDIEFAIENGEIFIVQSRPITTIAHEETKEEIKGKILFSGLAASPGVSSGVVRIVHSVNELTKVKKGDILVTEMTNPDMVVAMQRSAGIVTDEGGTTSHAAIVSREMGIPAVVGTNDATKKLHDGQMITVDGYGGRVYEGEAEKQEVVIEPIVQTKTKIKVIVDLPDYAERAAKSKAEAIGLVRLEGIIASSGNHPVYYVKEKKIDEYISVLVSGLKKIAEHFGEIWIRSSDIRTDEYRNLKGAIREIEGNPMLGDHGIRFSLKHKEIMKAELMAIKKIAEIFPLKQIGLMAPQIISVEEVREMKKIANETGIPVNLKFGIMVETPAAVQIINSLCEEGIDFISFGTNDLTQYTLAIDRNNSEVQNLYNEMHPAVLNSISYVIRRCKKYGVETSICGQAGSKPEMAKFLVEQGIDSISVNADAARKVSEIVRDIENNSVNSNNYKGKEINKELKKQEKEKSEEKFEYSGMMQEVVVPQMAMVEEEEINAARQLKQIMDAQGAGKVDVPEIEEKIEEKDIEEVILNELGDDYSPGDSNGIKKKDMPVLNDAIPVDSSDIEALSKEEEKEFDLSAELEKEDSDIGEG